MRRHVVSIVGTSGAGKSTLAAMLCHHGAKLISDGMTPINPETTEVSPGHARTKLNDESLQMLGKDPSNFELVHPESLKRYFPVAGTDTPRKLDLVLIVEDAQETSIEPISGAECLIKLVANAYLGSYLPPEYSPLLMQRAAKLIQQGVQVKSLRRLREPSKLLETVECIEKEVSPA